MVLLMFPSLLVIAAVVVARHHRLRQRWVSPYAGFRVAAARVTRTGETSFRVAGAQMARSAPSQ
jgi:hypothetical protein